MKNTKHTLLMSAAAAALMAGVGMAYAQAPAHPGASADKQMPVYGPKDASKDAAKDAAPEAGAKQGQADPKLERRGASKGGRDQRAQDSRKGEMGQKGTETMSPGKTGADMKADPKMGAGAKTGAKMQDRAPAKAEAAPASTTGSAPAGGSATLSTEQRSTIRAGITQQHAQPATNINFSISIGTPVPRNVHFYRVPNELVIIYPHWRGYDYFLVGDQIVVVDPRTHQIVAVIEA